MFSPRDPRLQRVYEVFAPYRDSLRLVQSSGIWRQMDQLSKEDFETISRHYDFEVLLHEKDVLGHFLPRLLELYGWKDDFKGHGWFLEFKLARREWLQWPAEEVEAMRGVLEMWTESALRDGEMEMFLDFLIGAEPDVSRYCDAWLRSNPLAVARYCWTISWINPNGFHEWAKRPHVRAKFEEMFFRNPDGEHAELFSRTVDLLRPAPDSS